MNYSEIDAWLKRKLQPVDGISTDYVSIRQKQGQSFEQVSRVKTDGKPIEEACEAIIEAIRDCVASWEADGKSSNKIQLRVYRAKEEDGCRIFSTGTTEPVQVGDASTREGELVATIKELRILASETTASLARVSGAGLQLATQTMAENARLQKENAELHATVMLLEAQPGESGIGKLLEQILPVVAARLEAKPG